MMTVTVMKSQRRGGGNVHPQLNHPVDLEILELPSLPRKTKTWKGLWELSDELSLSSDNKDSLDLFFPTVITNRKRKRRTRKQKTKRINQRNLENTGRRKNRPSHQGWQSLACFGEKNSKGKADPIILQAAWWCLVLNSHYHNIYIPTTLLLLPV